MGTRPTVRMPGNETRRVSVIFPMTWRGAAVAGVTGVLALTGVAACGSSSPSSPVPAPSSAASASPTSRPGQPAPLPSNLVAATSATLVGRWVPSPVRTYQGTGPFVSFTANGAWTGSDGCNGQGGTWTVGSGGAFHATSGPSTLIGCEGEPVGAWMVGAQRAGFSGSTLILLDASGATLGRLVKP